MCQKWTSQRAGVRDADAGVRVRLLQLEPGSQKEVLGLAVGANPLGQLIFSPLLGYWANRAGRARAPLVASLVLFVLASVLYAQLHLTRPHAHYWMLLARFLIGVSSGENTHILGYSQNICIISTL